MNEVAVFAKYWQCGQVKTRLAPQMGARRACELYRCFLTSTLVRMANQGDRRFLVYSPPASEPEFQQLVAQRPWQLRQQSEGDLGARLSHHVQQSLCADTQRLVILGADSPSLPVAWIERAFELLHLHDVVLGPTQDGGYYLIGVRRYLPRLFTGIDWGTDRVWPQTIERLRGMADTPTFAILPYWYDVDHPDDLRRLAIELTTAPVGDLALQSLAQCVRRALAG
jgi:rSAM/selenodomain-associated transferase 1